MTDKRVKLQPYPLGAHYEEGRIRFAFVSKEKDCGILLYNRKTGRLLRKIPFEPWERMGNVRCKYLPTKKMNGRLPSELCYQFYEGDEPVPDTHGRIFVGRHPNGTLSKGIQSYGKERSARSLRAGFLTDDFDWAGDENPRIPYEDCICYCMHVRGFTRHPSSGVAHRGTFLGIAEKLDYLKESGITTIELQPAYEFLEPSAEEEKAQGLPYGLAAGQNSAQGEARLNYWGYKRGYYYAPKSGYAYGEDASLEFKEMVRALHAGGVEVVMQFYFPEDVGAREIGEILRFWVQEYHVDGFHLMGGNLPATPVAEDPALADTKIWYYGFDCDALYGAKGWPEYKNLAVYQDDYLYAVRKFLKGDENMLGSMQYQLRCNPGKTGRIHYLSNYCGMTLADTVSYDRKHNEANGEENRDGTDYNCSWNCGEEGPTRKKKIRELRLRQQKNAFCMLLFSQSTPLIFMGDEFGNSQRGNNNPYCQDNPVTWLDWNDLKKNREIYEFWQGLVALRRAHPILHQKQEMRIMDYIACGYPDLSYHGENAWRPRTEGYNRHIGIMYCGNYAKTDKDRNDDFFYLAFNMHWESHTLGLPRLPKGLEWQRILTTTEALVGERQEEVLLPPRSIAVYKSVPETAGFEAEKSKRGNRSGTAARYEDRTAF